MLRMCNTQLLSPKPYDGSYSPWAHRPNLLVLGGRDVTDSLLAASGERHGTGPPTLLLNRRIAAWLAIILLAIMARPAVAQTIINVTDGPSLSAAIAQVDGNASASYVINFQNSITLSNAASNTLNAFNTTSNVTVNGNGFTLDGGSVQRGFFVFSGTVAIENLTVQNTQALGGSGGGAGGPVGGGGGGLGGALFVASSGIVTISNVTLLSNNASGGSGGSSSGIGTVGGGGGLGGTGGTAGGGGVGLGANGGAAPKATMGPRES
jgi:hypothetical protein